MGLSPIDKFSVIIPAIQKINPNSILDVGCGFGLNGYLIRAFCEVSYGRYQPDEWKTEITGIDIFENNITSFHKIIYNKIIVGNILNQDIPKEFDLVILGDIIEHFDKETGITLIKKLSSKAKFLLITTPHVFQEQGSLYGNDSEIHKSFWAKKDFKDYNCEYRVKGNSLLILVKPNGVSEEYFPKRSFLGKCLAMLRG